MYDETGLLREILSKYRGEEKVDRKIAREYDAQGRLSKIRNGSGGELTYHYDNLNRLVKQTVNDVPVEYSYDKYGRLVRKALMGFSGSPAVSELKYFYDPDGTIIAREVNGVRQAYKYDRRGQLLEVVGQERYAYDPAGNILSKTVNGVTTTYRYDRANQLVSSETEGKVTKYAYDAAGRLVKEGNKSYTYAWLDKLVSVSEAGKVSANFSYHFDGQIAGVTYADGRRENYLWDGLALIHRDGTELLNEPAVTGGNPVLSGDKVLFNDMLGNTLGVKGKDAYQPIKMTAFGESDNVDAFFTGKPLVGELGYAFLFRNYRPEQGKWQTADPLGYPDGWNNFAYVNNEVTSAIDRFGTDIYHVAYTGNTVGHSASIIGNPIDGYKAYNFGGDGGGYSMGDQNDKTYATAQEALAALNKGREGIYEYDKVQKWDTTPEQDKLAQDANKKHIDDGNYSWYWNNCTDAVEAALEAAGVDYETGVKPSTLFNNNEKYATTLNYKDFKRGLVE